LFGFLAFDFGSIFRNAPPEVAFQAAVLPYYSLKVRPLEGLISSKSIPVTPFLENDLRFLERQLTAHFALNPREGYDLPEGLFDYQLYATLYFKINFNFIQGINTASFLFPLLLPPPPLLSSSSLLSLLLSYMVYDGFSYNSIAIGESLAATVVERCAA